MLLTHGIPTEETLCTIGGGKQKKKKRIREADAPGGGRMCSDRSERGPAKKATADDEQPNLF